MSRFICFGALGLLIAGCYQLPETRPGKDEVFQAAESVILERYPMAVPIRDSQMLLARTPVEMEAAYLSCLQITVHVTQNFTGAWEPTVRVAKYIETGEPPLGGDPQADTPAEAHLVARNEWTPLAYMQAEAVAIQKEILARVRGEAKS